MASTQITCPHCGSNLNFGQPIAAGATIECLICMQPFPAPFAEAPKAIPPVSVAVSAKPIPVGKPAPIDRSTPVRRPVDSNATPGRGLLLAVAVALVLVFGVGVTFAVVKIALASRGQSSMPVVWNSEDPENPGAQSSDPAPSTKPNQKKPAPVSQEDDEDTRRLKEEEKKLLVRKASGAPLESTPKWESKASSKIQKNMYTGLTQKKVDLAIERGTSFLKKTQHATGTWASHQSVGHAALAGLTLLECKVPANDPFVQRAGNFVRLHVHGLAETYELSLAILFLDRLGEPRDRYLIQGMAMRLLAGQQETGGWNYQCPIMAPADMYHLYAFLQSHKNRNTLNPLPPALKDPLVAPDPVGRKLGRGTNALEQFDDLVVAKAPAKAKAVTPIRPEWLKPELQALPVVKHQGRPKGQQFIPQYPSGDNSNTQFALMGLWTARRHDVPADHAILVAHQRFVLSQNDDGGWGYTQSQGTSKSMTCVGLLAMAMGHAAAPDIIKFDPKNPKDAVVRPALEDTRIKKGLKALGSTLGEPILEGNVDGLLMQDLYFLWSVERVAMLYDLKTIDGKEWYPWGAQILVHRQRPAGDWNDSHYPGANPVINTCFALLFLQRSNLVQDLTNNLRFHSAIRDE